MELGIIDGYCSKVLGGQLRALLGRSKRAQIVCTVLAHARAAALHAYLATVCG